MVRHSAVDGVPQAAPKRSQTLNGLQAAAPLPGPPSLPLEVAKTLRAPSTTSATLRATPAASVDGVRIVDAATGQQDPLAPASLPPPSADPKEAQIHALRVELDAYRTGKKRPPDSAPPDRGAWQKLGYRVAAAAAGAAVLVITALGARAVSMIETKADAAKAAQKQTTDTVNARDVEWQTWARRVVAIEECRQQQMATAMERLLPAKDRLGAARPMAPWADECPSLPKPP